VGEAGSLIRRLPDSLKVGIRYADVTFGSVSLHAGAVWAAFEAGAERVVDRRALSR
jgi:hypothetical protein